AHQYGVWSIFDVRYHIELIVHAIDKVDVSRPANAIHCFRAARASSIVCMRGLIFRAAVGFSFDNYARDSRAVSARNDQFFTQQIARDFEHVWASVEFARQLHGINPPITQITQKENQPQRGTKGAKENSPKMNRLF